MAGDDRDLGGLTRALLLGASLGTIAIVQVGCTGPGSLPGGTGSTGTPRASAEELCARALQSDDHRDAEALIRSYPRADCLPATLGALPPQTLAQVSPTVLGRLPAGVRQQIPPQAAMHLRFPATQGREGRTESGPY